MAKKRKNKSTVNLNIHPVEGVPSDTLLLSEVFVELVYIRIKEGIEEALKNKKNVATLFQINNSEYYSEVGREYWESGLESAIKYYSDKEKYEECTELKLLKDRISVNEKVLI